MPAGVIIAVVVVIALAVHVLLFGWIRRKMRGNPVLPSVWIAVLRSQ